jgi:hypothetical protein
MKTRFLLFFLLGCLFAKAQNIEVNGLQSGVWEADTVFVIGDVIVQNSLDIMAGTTVIFNGFYGINIEDGASLNALGTENDSILFTVTDTTGFHLFNFGRGGWNGIRMKKAGTCKLDYCRFQYGKAALDNDQDGGALRIFNSNDVEISHSTLFCNFSREHGGALNAVDSKVMIHDCKVNNNLTYSEIDTIYFMYGAGLRFLKCEVDIIDTDFNYNIGESAIGGALSLDSCSINIDRCRFEHNYGINGGGLYLIRSNDWECSITNSLFANNISGHFGGGLAISDSSPLVSNLTVVGNLSIGVNCGGIFFYQHSSPVVWNCIVYGNANDAPLDEPVQLWSWTYDDYAPEFHNCLIQYGFENISNHEVIVVYENCLDEDPLFADPDNENFRLDSDSPCINVGSLDTPAAIINGFDLDGHQRVSDGRIDIGAYEFDLTGIQETAQNENLILIVGNPVTASSYAEIELDHVCHFIANVYAVDGKLLVAKNLGNAQAGLNRIEIGGMFQDLAQGTYLFVIRTPEQTFVAKTVKQ